MTLITPAFFTVKFKSEFKMLALRFNRLLGAAQKILIFPLMKCPQPSK